MHRQRRHQRQRQPHRPHELRPPDDHREGPRLRRGRPAVNGLHRHGNRERALRRVDMRRRAAGRRHTGAVSESP